MATLPVPAPTRLIPVLTVLRRWWRAAVQRRQTRREVRPWAVLAPLLPTLLLLGLTVAGLSDPPADAHLSRLHVPVSAAR